MVTMSKQKANRNYSNLDKTTQAGLPGAAQVLKSFILSNEPVKLTGNYQPQRKLSIVALKEPDFGLNCARLTVLATP